MLKVITPESEYEEKLQALEEFLTENNISIIAGNNSLEIMIDSRTFNLIDIESLEEVSVLPRIMDSERMVWDG